MRVSVVLAMVLGTSAVPFVANSQWAMQTSGVTASFRGIDSVGGGVAWASGTSGTVVRTLDGGKHWTKCAVPAGGEKLDFRGVQAFDAKTAIVMSSGPGDLSRLYKTVDGCATWKLLATNPDKTGFWDSVKSYDDNGSLISDHDPAKLLILGDSVGGKPKIWEWNEGDGEISPTYGVFGSVLDGEGSFAASNSVLEVADTPQVDKVWKWNFRWASGVPNHVFMSYVRSERTPTCEPCRMETKRVEVPMTTGAQAAGIFSFHFRTEMIGVAVGGDYEKPTISAKTAAISSDGGLSWELASSMPHGYRSAVAYDAKLKAWITVGPNGTDVSTDDGKNWRALRPASGDAPDADKGWNALSLPFVVGDRGRIGILRDGAMVTK